MKNFKEWLSDYLRYIMLLLAAVLIFFLVMIGVRLYQHHSEPDLGNVVEIYPETGGQTEAGQESETASETESEAAPETESEAESESEKETESEKASEAVTEKKDLSGNESEKENAEAQSEKPGTSLIPEDGSGVTITRQSEKETVPTTGSTSAPTSLPTQAPTPTPTPTPTPMPTPTPTPMPTPEPVYMTLTGSCYLRSGPGYEYEIIGEYIYGTTVRVLDDSTGWYKVEVDGITGYMGGRFFH